MVGTVALWCDTTMKLPPLIRTFDFNCDLKTHWFLVTAWGGRGPERILFQTAMNYAFPPQSLQL